MWRGLVCATGTPLGFSLGGHVEQRDAEEPFSRTHVHWRSIRAPSLCFPPRTLEPLGASLRATQPIVSAWLRAHQPQISQRKQLAVPDAKPHDAHFSIFLNVSHRRHRCRLPAVNPQHQEMTTRTLPGVGVRENFYPDLVPIDIVFRVLPSVPLNCSCGFGVTSRATPSPPYHQTLNPGYTFISLLFE